MDKCKLFCLIALLLPLVACEAATSTIEDLEMTEEAVEFSEGAESEKQIVEFTPPVIQPEETLPPSNTPGAASDEKIKSTPTSAPPQDTVVETESFRGVIFTAEHIATSPYWPHNDEPWTPSEGDILILEDKLSEFLQDESPELWQRLETYTRQYWGTVTADGSRAIYASFLCDAERMSSYIDWRTDPIEVMDGGDCYFQTLFDVEAGIIVWLAINGEA